MSAGVWNPMPEWRSALLDQSKERWQKLRASSRLPNWRGCPGGPELGADDLGLLDLSPAPGCSAPLPIPQPLDTITLTDLPQDRQSGPVFVHHGGSVFGYRSQPG